MITQAEYITNALDNAEEYIKRVKVNVDAKHHTQETTDLKLVAWRKFLACGTFYTRGNQMVKVDQQLFDQMLQQRLLQ